MKKAKVICVGQTCIDILLKGFSPTELFKSERYFLDSISFNLGGDATNEAKTLSAMGYEVSLVSYVGKDSSSEYIKNILEESNINTDYFLYAEEKCSPTNCIFIEPDGERKFVLGKNSVYFSPSMNLPFVPLDDVKLVSLASLFLEPLLDPKKVLAFVTRVKENDIILCADLRTKESRDLSAYAKIFEYIDYLFPNYEEAQFYSHAKTPEEAADFFLNLGVKNVVVKTGKDGCYVKNNSGDVVSVPAYLTKIVDSTGAGDNFAAGFISGLLDGKNLEDCCKFACAAAHIAVKEVGAFGVIKNKKQVEDVIATTKKS